ncbi:SPFH domain-containing protein [Geoalkalibacter sp.]|uniref:SPFH domain-containing protein n=1 Tax=Geoalkalibacter sp. TaxID=3041440 RepID=UPI00272DEEE6|nr:SPFH domain-containing protein [Geoalkalibacter sp.]
MEPAQTYSFLQRARVRGLIKKAILLLLIGALLYTTVAMVYATKTIYKVRRNYAVILEALGGERKVVEEVGWHARLPLFTRIELEVPLMNQQLFLGGQQEPQRIMSLGNVALWTSAMMTYRISDLERWGIENRQPLVLLQADFDGIVKDVMQSKSVDALISEREEIKDIIFEALKNRPINVGGPNLESKYGIEVVSFVLRDTRFGDRLAEASEEKKRRELIAEAENYAAALEASRTRTLYAAYSDSIREFREALGLGPASDPYLFEFLNQQKWATAYEKNPQGQNTFVLNNSSGTPPVALPAPPFGPSPTRREATEDGQTAQNPQPGLRPALREADKAD